MNPFITRSLRGGPHEGRVIVYVAIGSERRVLNDAFHIVQWKDGVVAMDRIAGCPSTKEAASDPVPVPSDP